MTPSKKARLSNMQTAITIEFARHTTEATSFFSVLSPVLTLGAVVLIWPLVSVYSGISNSSVSVCSVVSVSVVCMVVYSTVVKSVVYVSMCSAVMIINVHRVGSVN